jgi:hypothetical protein
MSGEGKTSNWIMTGHAWSVYEDPATAKCKNCGQTRSESLRGSTGNCRENPVIDLSYTTAGVKAWRDAEKKKQNAAAYAAQQGYAEEPYQAPAQPPAHFGGGGRGRGYGGGRGGAGRGGWGYN